MRVRIRVRILTLKYVRCRRTRPRGRRTRPSSWRRPPRLTATPTCVSFRPQRPTPALFHRAVSHSFRSSVALFDVRDARSSAPPSTTTKLCVATGSRTRGWCGAHPATPAPGPLFRLSERSTRCCASVFQQPVTSRACELFHDCNICYSATFYRSTYVYYCKMLLVFSYLYMIRTRAAQGWAQFRYLNLVIRYTGCT